MEKTDISDSIKGLSCSQKIRERKYFAMNKRKENLIFGILAVIFGVLIIAMCVITGKQSYGMEGDELFCYISATSQGGWKGICYLDDQTWYEGSYFYDALTATGSERFNIPMVVANQAMDVHPPLYYIFLNIVCSFFPGQFSRWYGIGVNIFLVLLVAAGLFLLLDFFIKKKYVSLILSTIFCCSYLTVDMVLFVRMYVMLMVCFLFQSWYHLLLYQWISGKEDFNLKKEWKKYLLLGIITVAGALTHYYYLVYQALISALFVVILWKKRRVRESISYMITMACSGIAYCCMYPAALRHIFFKYEGRDAVHKFLKTTSLFGEGVKMLKAFNEDFFKGTLFWLIGFLAIASVILVLCRRFEWKTLGNYVLLILPSIIYFWGISKASPFIVLRYVAPVAALIYTFIVLWLLLIFNGIRSGKAGYVICCVIMGALVFFYPVRSVKNSYFEERAQIVEKLADDCEYCVYITGDEYNWKMWEDFIIYPDFEALFFIDGVKKLPVNDEKLLGQEELVIFIDKALDQGEIDSYMKEAFPQAEFETLYETPYVYIVFMQG